MGRRAPGKPFGEGNHEPEAVSEAKARTVLQAIALARLEAVLGRVFEGLLPGGALGQAGWDGWMDCNDAKWRGVVGMWGAG